MNHQIGSSATSELLFEIPGEKLGESLAKQVKEKVRSLCNWRSSSFPGSQPVSLTRGFLAHISRNPYVACEKTDGIRLLLLAASNKVLLIDRNEEVRAVDMHLPRENKLEEAHQVTLLDGELVLDEEEFEEEEEEDNKHAESDLSAENSAGGNAHRTQSFSSSTKSTRKKILRYLVYDTICIQRDSSIKETNLLNRLAFAYKSVVKPMIEYKNLLAAQGKKITNPFDIYIKDFYEIWDIDIIKKYASKLPHLSDGIIFTPVKLPYISGTCKQLFKWKPPHLNTVDFSVDFIYDDTGKPRLVQLFVAKKGFRTFMGHFCAPFGNVYKELLERAEKGAASGIIVECYWAPGKPVMTFLPTLRNSNAKTPSSASPSSKSSGGGSKRQTDGKPPYDLTAGDWIPGGWVAERIRGDKQLPNDFRIVHKILESIEDGVTFEELNEEFNKYRSRGKKRAADFCILPSFYESFEDKENEEIRKNNINNVFNKSKLRKPKNKEEKHTVTA